jgi:mannose-1-phosphate guanylyltransferase
MKALLLAGGYGTRLKPITNKLPKCLVPINNRPLIDYWLERLKNIGIEKIFINTHYLHKKVEEYLEKSKYKKNVTLIHEPILMGTAGTLIKNYKIWKNDESLLVAHADNYCLEDLAKLQEAHNKRPDNCHITMMTFVAKKPSNCGVVLLNNKKIVINFYEKHANPPSNLANGAIYIFSNIALGTISTKYPNSRDISVDLIPKFLGKIFTYETKSTLIDIGSLESYEYVCKNYCELE